MNPHALTRAAARAGPARLRPSQTPDRSRGETERRTVHGFGGRLICSYTAPGSRWQYKLEASQIGGNGSETTFKNCRKLACA